MFFEWNESKNRANQIKHGVYFSKATEAFYDLNQVTFYEGAYENEDRWVLIGFAFDLMLLVVIHTTKDLDDETVRIISARPATPQERKLYARENR